MVVSECPCVGFAVNLMLGLYQGASSHYYAIIIATQSKTLNPLLRYAIFMSRKRPISMVKPDFGTNSPKFHKVITLTQIAHLS